MFHFVLGNYPELHVVLLQVLQYYAAVLAYQCHLVITKKLCIHIQDSLEKGARMIYVRTGDTDVIVIIAGVFFELQTTYPGLNIWVAFGMGKRFQYYHINTICSSLGEPKCQALPFYHV